MPFTSYISHFWLPHPLRSCIMNANVFNISCYHYTMYFVQRTQRQYAAIEYLLSKLLVELPVDALVAAVFGQVLHVQSQLKGDRKVFTGVLCLLGCACSSLGLGDYTQVSSLDSLIIHESISFAFYSYRCFISKGRSCSCHRTRIDDHLCNRRRYRPCWTERFPADRTPIFSHL